MIARQQVQFLLDFDRSAETPIVASCGSTNLDTAALQAIIPAAVQSIEEITNHDDRPERWWELARLYGISPNKYETTIENWLLLETPGKKLSELMKLLEHDSKNKQSYSGAAMTFLHAIRKLWWHGMPDKTIHYLRDSNETFEFLKRGTRSPVSLFLFLIVGYDPNMVGDSKWTLLTEIIRRRNETKEETKETIHDIAILLAHGADINYLIGKYTTALRIARDISNGGDPEIAAFLVSRGAKVAEELTSI